MTSDALFESNLRSLALIHRGKVRDVYEVGADRLLMVASDRVSAFDVVMSRAVPRKGEVLTLLTAWWLERLEVEHHLIAVDPERIVALVSMPLIKPFPSSVALISRVASLVLSVERPAACGPQPAMPANRVRRMASCGKWQMRAFITFSL